MIIIGALTKVATMITSTGPINWPVTMASDNCGDLLQSVFCRVPPVIIHFRLGFQMINHPAIGVPSFLETPKWAK